MSTSVSAYPPSVQAGIPRLGTLPRGWSRVAMGDLLRPVYRPVEIIDDQIYQLVTARRSRGGIVARERLPGRDIKVKDQYAIRAGDFILSNRQISHGGVGLVPPELNGAIVSGEYTVLEPCGPIDLAYLNAFSHSIHFQQICFHSSIGVHVEKLVFRLDDWLSWKIDLPPLDEQRRIAGALAVWDHTINTAEALVAAKLARVRYVAHRIAQDCATTVRLGDAASINARSLEERTPNDFRFEYFPISSEPDEDSDSGWMTFAEAPSRARRIAKAGDLLYSTVRPLLRRLFIATEHPSAVYSTGYAVLECNESMLSSFLFFMMTTPCVERQIHARLTGSSYPAISATDLSEVAVPLPSLKQQRSASDALQSLAKEAETLANLSRYHRIQSRGLMQRLLSGEWRLSVTTSEQAA
jgi:type I restriction enzyme, S subunit